MAIKRLKSKGSKKPQGNRQSKLNKLAPTQPDKDRMRKTRKDAKKTNAKGMQIGQLPNKGDVVKAAQQANKVRAEQERQQRREAQAQNKQSAKKETSLAALIANAEQRGELHSILNVDEAVATNPNDVRDYKGDTAKDTSLKSFYKEFKRVIDHSDVILEVVDARDPLGTRCVEVEKAVKAAPGQKRLVVVLNKADLVPRENLDRWLKYLRQFHPVTAFKASTQDQASRLGRRKMNKAAGEDALKGSPCVGAELLMSMLANYCRKNGVKTAIRVGIVGIPNVGKSSIINSLTRGRACNVGCTPGVTRSMQEVELDAKIRLLDSPGIVFTAANREQQTGANILKNAQRVTDIKDPFAVAEKILQRASKSYFCKLYDLATYDTADEFFAMKAHRMGKFLRGGIPDATAAARGLLNDWNTGKIKYCTQPPESRRDDEVHVSASIVSHEAREFDLDNFEAMETEALQSFAATMDGVMEYESSGPVEMAADQVEAAIIDPEVKPTVEKMDEDGAPPAKRVRGEPTAKKVKDAAMLLEGNQTINRNRKADLKKAKKRAIKTIRKVDSVADILDNFTLAF